MTQYAESSSYACATADHGKSELELLPRNMLGDLADLASTGTRAELDDLEELAASASVDANFLLSIGPSHRARRRLHNCRVNTSAPKVLYADKASILKSVERNPFALQFASEDLRADFDVVTRAASINGLVLEHASPSLRADREVVLLALQNSSGAALKYADAELRADRDLVMAAIASGANALQHASPSLADDQDVAKAAVARHFSALEHVSARLRTDVEVTRIAAEAHVDVKPSCVQCHREHWDRAFVTSMVGRNAKCLREFGETWQDDREVVEAAVAINPCALEHASPRLRNCKPLVQTTLSLNPNVFCFVGDELKNDVELLRLVLGRSGAGIRHVPTSVRRSPFDADMADQGFQLNANASADDDTIPNHDRTTLMFRNLPNNYNRSTLLHMLDSEGFKGTYNFVYFADGFHNHAFVNFVTHNDAKRAKASFQGFARWRVPSCKTCDVVWSGPVQGLQAHTERYRNSPVMHDNVPDEYKPAVFVDGIRVPFPVPTKRIRPPRVRRNSAGDGGGIAAPVAEQHGQSKRSGRGKFCFLN